MNKLIILAAICVGLNSAVSKQKEITVNGQQVTNFASFIDFSKNTTQYWSLVTTNNLVGWATITNMETYSYSSDKDVEEKVRLMAKEGYICKVFGHTWELGCGVKGCAVYHEVIYHCKFCAKTKELKWEIKE